jgi:phosphoadenosine phosphosulfate reductase
LEEFGDNVDDVSAEELVAWAKERFGKDLILSSSFGADSAVMLHLATQIVPDITVLFVDTGYLFPETYRFAESLRDRLGFRLHVVGPTMTAARQEALYGNLWEQGEEGVRRYLEINKVEPMKRGLRELGARGWISGVRAHQTEHRRGLSRIKVQDGCVKLHPILDWNRAQVDQYLLDHQLPKHPLVAQGYLSIGDWHSTIPVLEGEDERSGRLLGTKKECGLHLTDGERLSFDSSHL